MAAMRGQELVSGEVRLSSLALPRPRNGLNAQKKQMLLGAACGEKCAYLGGEVGRAQPHT